MADSSPVLLPAKASCLALLVLLPCFCVASDSGASGLRPQLASSSSSPSSSYPHLLVSGVYAEQLPSPIFYDTFVPIVFEYQLPEWNKSEVTFNNWYTCLSETTPYKYTCPTVFHMNKAVLNLHIDFESLQPIQDKGSHSSYFQSLYRSSSFCDTIQKHFSGVFIADEELETYLEMLGRCHDRSGSTDSTGVGHIERGIPDYNYTLRAPFSKMENNYYNTYYKPMNANNSGLDLVASATLSNARTTIQAILLNVFYAEKYRWVHALQDCQQQLLPHSLVTLQKLNTTLLELAVKPEFESTYEFAIGLELLSKYYSLPLTDCTYTANSFVVRLLFPVRRSRKAGGQAAAALRSLALYNLRPVPFHYENKFCHVELLQSASGQSLAHDSERNVTYRTTCQPNALCPTGELLQSRNIDYCSTAILTNNFTATKDNCDFDCKDAPQSLLEDLLVTRVSSDMFVITSGSSSGGGNSNSGAKAKASVRVNCSVDGGGSGLLRELRLVDSGALQVHLPCKCQLISSTSTTGSGSVVKDVYFSEYPCAEAAEGSPSPFTQIEPWHLHYSDSLDNDSSTDPGVRQYFLVRKAIYLQQLNDPASIEHLHLHDDDYVTHGAAGDGGAAAHQIGGGAEGSGGGSGNALLWIFVTISVLALSSLQIYIIVQLRYVKLQSGEGPTLMQSMLFNVRGSRRSDPEPEFRLLNDQ